MTNFNNSTSAYKQDYLAGLNENEKKYIHRNDEHTNLSYRHSTMTDRISNDAGIYTPRQRNLKTKVSL